MSQTRTRYAYGFEILNYDTLTGRVEREPIYNVAYYKNVSDDVQGDEMLVYLYLATVDKATISELQLTLDMQQLTLFPTLNTLEGRGLIERTGETFTAAA